MFDYVLGYISNWLSAFPCLNSSNFPFFKPKKLSSRNIHPGIITKRIQPITFLGNAILKPFLQTTFFDLSFFSPSNFCVFLLICLWVSTELSPESVLSFFFSTYVSGSDLCLPHVLVFVKHFRIKLNFMTAVLWYLKKKKQVRRYMIWSNIST